MDDGIELRHVREEDLPLIANSWLRSNRNSPAALRIRNDEYYRGHKTLIARLLDRFGAVVACSSESPDVIIGWCCFERDPGILHYVYVKESARGLGIAKSMLDHGYLTDREVRTSHLTRAIDRWSAQGHRYRYDPYLLMEI